MASSEAENNSPSMRNAFGGVNWAETVIQNQTDTVIIEELKSPNEFETALKDINEEIGLAEEFGSAKKSFKNPDALDNLICHVHLKRLGFMIQKKTNVFSQPRHEETEHRPVTIQQRLTNSREERLAVRDDVHIELLAKRFQASHSEGKISFILVEADSQPYQQQ